MITLAGFIPDQDIKIEYTGLRDGEKLFEELFSDKEPLIDTPHPKIKVANFSNIPLDFTQKLNTLLGLDLNTDPKVVRETLKEIVPEFKPSLPSVNSSLN
jgi:FlaA1/EpsC-like NDP-sugar epimerase